MSDQSSQGRDNIMDDKRTAIILMQMALEYLDKSGERHSACYLQHALDLAEGVPPLKPGEELSPELVASLLPPAES